MIPITNCVVLCHIYFEHRQLPHRVSSISRFIMHNMGSCMSVSVCMHMCVYFQFLIWDNITSPCLLECRCDPVNLRCWIEFQGATFQVDGLFLMRHCIQPGLKEVGLELHFLLQDPLWSGFSRVSLVCMASQQWLRLGRCTYKAHIDLLSCSPRELWVPLSIPKIINSMKS